MTNEVTQRLVCQIPGGLSVDDSAVIARIANNSNSHVTIEYKGNIYTAHSILRLLSIDIEKGDLVRISACGKDAEETVRKLGELLVKDTADVSRRMYFNSCEPSMV